MKIKSNLIGLLLILSLPVSSMDEDRQQLIMRNGQKYAENLRNTQERLDFMKNGGNFQASVKTNVYIDSQPVSNPKTKEKDDIKEYLLEEDENIEKKDDQQINTNSRSVSPIKQYVIKPDNIEKVFSDPSKITKINLTPIHSGQGNIIINLYNKSTTLKGDTDNNDDKEIEQNQ